MFWWLDAPQVGTLRGMDPNETDKASTTDASDEPLREEDVLREDRLDDRVVEGEGLPEGE